VIAAHGKNSPANVAMRGEIFVAKTSFKLATVAEIAAYRD